MSKKTKREEAWEALVATLEKFPKPIEMAALRVLCYGMTVEQLHEFHTLMRKIHAEKYA